MCSAGRLALLSLLVLTACKPALEIELVHDSLPSPRFEITRRDGSAPGYYTHVQVIDSDRNEVWTARADPPGATSGAPNLVYGELPPGFVEVRTARPLEDGREYFLVVSGEAYGQLGFRVVGGRVAVIGRDGETSPMRGGSDAG